MHAPTSLTASEAAAKIARGELTSEELTRACLERIASRDHEIRAFIHISPVHAIEQAKARDLEKKQGRPLGPLHGVPVGLKDIFDTTDFPTENGWRLHKGRQPLRDATVVTKLRGAGAVIIGKTVTTECAYFHPGATRNPHDLSRTPGGSSSGSAAAVAAGMIPLALGSQTNGSMIRPASFCGTVGGKPSHGLISRAGAFSLSRHLDHVGVFARSVEDLALAYDVLAGSDPDDPATLQTKASAFRAEFARTNDVRPKFAFVRTPKWDDAELSTRAGFNQFVARLGKSVTPVGLPAGFADCWPAQRVVMSVEMNRNFGDEARLGGPGKSSEILLNFLAEGRDTPLPVYEKAIESAPALAAMFETAIKDFDVALALSARGEAPSAETTGDPVFCTPWSLLGMPAVTLPLLSGENGLPVGVQVVGRKGDDLRVLRAADWLWRKFRP